MTSIFKILLLKETLSTFWLLANREEKLVETNNFMLND